MGTPNSRAKRRTVVVSTLLTLLVLAALLVQSPPWQEPDREPANEIAESATANRIVGTAPDVDEGPDESVPRSVPDREPVTDVPEPRSSTSLLVRVVDRASGEPVPNFAAALFSESYVSFDSVLYGVSGDRGEILWEDIDWDRVVISPASSREYFTLQRGRVNERIHEVDLVFTVQGIVVDAREQPVSGAEVWTFYDNIDHADQRIAAVTELDGGFSLPVYGIETVFAFARASGRAASRIAMVSRPKEGSSVWLRLAIGEEAGTIIGDVVEPQGRSIPGAVVRVRGSTVSLPPQTDPTMTSIRDVGPVSKPVRADASGQFRFEDVPTGEATLMVTAPGSAGTVAKVDVVRGGTSQVRVSMTAGARVVGTVLSTDGEQLGDVTVVARRHSFATRSTTTNRDGTYRLENVQPGVVILEAYRGQARVQDRAELDNGRESRWDPVFGIGRQIRGKILTFDGKPFGQRLVRISAEDGDFRRIQTDVEGRFSFPDLKDQPYEIGAYPPGFPLPVTVAQNMRPADRELILRLPQLPAQDAYASGRLLDSGGKPITATRVTGREATRDGFLFEEVVSADGRFRLGPMLPGDWSFSFQAEGYPRLIENAAVGAGETADLGDLLMAETVPVEVSVLGAEGRVVALLWGEGMENERVTVESGRARLPPLAAGEYQLDFFGDDVARHSLNLKLLPGREARYEVVLQPAVLRSVAVVLPDETDSSLLRMATFDDNGRELTTWRLRWYRSWGPRKIPFRPQAARLVVTSEDGKQGEARLESEDVRIMLR